jgi:hypothetical protein
MINKATELSVFLENKPGELHKLARLLGENSINILAMSIQDPTQYIQRLFEARQQTLRRIASTASYGAILKEASHLTLIRFVTSDPEGSIKVLEGEGYKVDTQEVVLALLDHQPGRLASISEAFAREGININYTYGSALDEMKRALFVFQVSDTSKALEVI